MHTYHDFAVVFCHVLTLRLALDLMDIWRSFATMQSLPTWANRCIRSTYRVRVSTVLVHAVDNPSLVVVVVLDFAPNACHFAVVFCHLSYSSRLGLVPTLPTICAAVGIVKGQTDEFRTNFRRSVGRQALQLEERSTQEILRPGASSWRTFRSRFFVQAL